MLRPRPTTYRGIEMRSRLEAHYAAKLDRAVARRGSFTWRYEPNAYADTTGQYLPDLVVTDGFDTVLVEVKPTEERAYAALPQMRIAHSSDSTLHLLATWRDDEALTAGEHEDWAWRHVLEPGSRAGMADWLEWFAYHRIDRVPCRGVGDHVCSPEAVGQVRGAAGKAGSAVPSVSSATEAAAI